jgi:hypothetical protein
MQIPAAVRYSQTIHAPHGAIAMKATILSNQLDQPTMSHEPSSPWRPAPQPQHELDRLMQLAPRDPSVHGEMFRLLLNLDEICIYVPPHPELVGEHWRSADEGFTWCNFGDAEGPFAPVFTSVACADYALRNLPQRDGPLPMIASLPAKVLFKFLNDGHTTARILGAVV